MNYYEILEVDQSAGYAEIKRSYRRLVKIYHPDVNPSALAAEKIVQITEAYEVLSDPVARGSYDWQINLAHTPDIDFIYKPEPQVDERELRRREYVKWKRQKEQERWQHQFHLKTMFYKYQRYFAYLFLVIGLVFTVDHFINGEKRVVEFDAIRIDTRGNTKISFRGDNLWTTSQLFRDYEQSSGPAYMYYSGVFHKKAKIGMEGYPAYTIQGTLYQFGNFFAFLVILLSAGLIQQKKYSDFMLTVGLLPVFLVWFLLVFLIVS
ncbi:J domain-containing protein [Marinoscillum sp.]|uniref:J domain-containing protein n=1 Tax=Marinoscillum sp. TaxID=2024838 RepID=UPI003BA9F139